MLCGRILLPLRLLIDVQRCKIDPHEQTEVRFYELLFVLTANSSLICLLLTEEEEVVVRIGIGYFLQRG